jgi:hypothetical protein
LHLADAYRRPFVFCRLVQAGEPADLRVPIRSGKSLLRLRTRVGIDGLISGRGQLILTGASAAAARRGQLDLRRILDQLLAPIGAAVKPGVAKRDGSGPVYLPFAIHWKAGALDPASWLGAPLPELAYLRPGEVLGPITEDRSVEWIFEWPKERPLPPPTRMASVGSGPVTGSATWSLGPQSTLRFVRSISWNKNLARVQPAAIAAALGALKLAPVALPAP